MITPSVITERHRSPFQFRLTTFLLIVAGIGYSLWLLINYGMDIVVPLSFVVGAVLGILAARGRKRLEILGGTLGGALGYATSGTVILVIYPTHMGRVWDFMADEWPNVLVDFLVLLLFGLSGGLILSLVYVLSIRMWRAINRWQRWAIAVLALIAFVTLIPWPYRQQDYQGDGSMRDRGFFMMYDRYIVSFPPVSLSKPDTYTFRCSPLPSAEFYFSMRPVSPQGSNVLSRLTTRVDVQLSDGESNVERVSDPLALWKLAIGGVFLDYWHEDFVTKKLARMASYQLTIRVSDVAPNSPTLEVVPSLKAAGEWPCVSLPLAWAETESGLDDE